MTGKGKSNAGWRVKAARAGALIPLGKFHPAVRAWAARRRSEVWCVALSGGADSLALLLLLWAHRPERRGKIVALHFNHRLRGRESTAEEKFCRQVCAALGLRLRVGQWRGQHPGASEAEARATRHRFFAKEMKSLRSRALWLAHQQDDIAETMLMRLARGSGTAGLAAPRPVHPTVDGRIHLRPLLTLKKAELVAALRLVGARWREDSSNASDDHFRNRVRHRVMPAWMKVAGRDALAGAALSRELLEEDDRALESWAEKLAPVRGQRWLNMPDLTGVPRAVLRRVLRRWLIVVRPKTDLSRQGFELLLTAVELGCPTRFSLGAKGFAVITQGRLAYQNR